MFFFVGVRVAPVPAATIGADRTSTSSERRVRRWRRPRPRSSNDRTPVPGRGPRRIA
ncbi:MAG: hypothetical protein OXG81_11960 [Acidobacteria bacterium]|nr:hypothetical protein [Acidobacteriota bacterium]